MNKIYKTIWCETTRSWVAVSEHANGKRGGATAAATTSARPIWTRLRGISLAALAAFGLGLFASPAAFAQSNSVMCANYNNGILPTYTGYGASPSLTSPCTTGIGSWAGGVTPGSTTNWIGLSADDTQIVLNGSTGNIYFRAGGTNGNTLTMSNVAGSGPTGGVLLSGVAAGAVTATSSQAINGSQLYSLSTSASTGIGSLSSSMSTFNSSISSLSTGLSSTNSGLTSLSTSASTGLSSANSSIASLSSGLSSTNSSLTSLSTSASSGISTAQSGVNSLSTGLSTTNSTVASLSTSTSTGIGSLSTGLSSTNSSLTSLSTSASSGISSANSSVASLSTSTSTGIGSLSTGLSTTNSNLTSLSTSTSTGLSSA
ncbi:ESPR domain-containing protein, partial [Burkholderia pseudomallei]